MGFKEVASLDAENTITLGGRNKKTGKANPTTIEGYFIGTKGGLPNRFNPDKPNQLHHFQTPDGVVAVWGKTNLDQKLRGVMLGTMTKVTFTGTRPSGKGNDMLCYRVEIDSDNTTPVSAYAVNDAVDSNTYSTDETSDSDSYEDEDELDDETPADEVEVKRPIPPSQAARKPSAEAQAKVRAMLNGKSKVA